MEEGEQGRKKDFIDNCLDTFFRSLNVPLLNITRMATQHEASTPPGSIVSDTSTSNRHEAGYSKQSLRLIVDSVTMKRYLESLRVEDPKMFSIQKTVNEDHESLRKKFILMLQTDATR